MTIAIIIAFGLWCVLGLYLAAHQDGQAVLEERQPDSWVSQLSKLFHEHQDISEWHFFLFLIPMLVLWPWALRVMRWVERLARLLRLRTFEPGSDDERIAAAKRRQLS
jgi:hypothetical protein